MKKIAVVLAALTLMIAGCSSTSRPTQTLEIATVNMSFEPKVVTVTKGQPMKIVLKNSDTLLHDWSIANIPAKVQASAGDDHGHADSKGAVHVAADVGRSGTVEFTPTKAGTYDISCTVPGHKEAGMTGTLQVN